MFMNDEHSPKILAQNRKPTLEDRLSDSPLVHKRIVQIVDLMEKALAEGYTADEAEEMAIEQVDGLGNDILWDWAANQEKSSFEKTKRSHPDAIADSKKNLHWVTTFGEVSVVERILRLGRRGKRLRPFSTEGNVKNRSCSFRLQRVLADFGSEESFGQVVKRVKEHYRIDVTLYAAYSNTLKHAKAMGGIKSGQSPRPAEDIITEVDGTMVPMTQAGKGVDKRKKKTVSWGEVRLCFARRKGETQSTYGAIRGSIGSVGILWEDTVQQSGFDPSTKIHCISDGAPWIANLFQEIFQDQGDFLLDFYHVSEYLSDASKAIKPTEATKWRRSQQSKLLTGKSKSVITELARHKRPNQEEDPVTKGHNYLSRRKDCLHYDKARAAGLPIGSGEVESGHRHVIQKRMKISGAWWKEAHVQPMLNLRSLRANQLWEEYWSQAKN
jgi:hypothetical protein